MVPRLLAAARAMRSCTCADVIQTPRLICKLVPGQCREYEDGLLLGSCLGSEIKRKYFNAAISKGIGSFLLLQSKVRNV